MSEFRRNRRYSKRRQDIAPVPVDNRVKMYRRLYNMSQQDLSSRCNLHASIIYKIESRITAPKITTAMTIADALRVPLQDLFFREGQNPPIHLPEELR